jgi:hypothetical protein
MLGEEGAKEICSILQENKSLTHLDLSNNIIGQYLGYNNFRDESGKDIGICLQTNNTLTSLILSICHL